VRTEFAGVSRFAASARSRLGGPHGRLTAAAGLIAPVTAASALHPSCARLLSLADAALASSASGPHDLGMLPAPGVGAARVCSRSPLAAPALLQPASARSPWQAACQDPSRNSACATGERRTQRGKDAGRPNSSCAIWPTEDAAPRCVRRRPTRAGGFGTGPQERHAGGSEGIGHSSHRPRAARSYSALTGFGTHPATADQAGAPTPSPSPAHPGRGTVTSAASRGAQATLNAASGLTATAAHNPIWSAASGVALPVDLLASVNPLPLISAIRQADPLPSTTTTSRTTRGRLKASVSTQSTPTGGPARLRTLNQGVI
jgi:hypothetical protein